MTSSEDGENRVRAAREPMPSEIAALLDESPDLVAVLSADAVVFFASSASRDLLGVEPDRLVGMSLLDLVHPDERPLVNRWRTEALASLTPVTFMHRISSATDEFVWVETRMRAVRRDHTASTLVASFRDASVRVLADRGAVLAENRSRRILAALSEGVLVVDESGHIEQANPAAEQLFGARGGLVGLTRTRFESLDEDGVPVPAEELPFHVAMRTGAITERVVATRRSSGDLVFLRVRAVPLQGIDGADNDRVAVILEDVVGRSIGPSPEQAGVAATVRQGESAGPLTDREYDVLGLLATGLSIRDISERLVLSEHTVRGHVKALLAKLGAHSQLEAVVIALRTGLLYAAPTNGHSPP